MAPCSLPPYPFSTQIGPAHLIMHNRVEVEYNPATKCNRFVMPFVYSLFFHKPLRHTRKENKLTSALLHICIRLGKEKKKGGGEDGSFCIFYRMIVCYDGHFFGRFMRVLSVGQEQMKELFYKMMGTRQGGKKCYSFHFPRTSWLLKQLSYE